MRKKISMVVMMAVGVLVAAGVAQAQVPSSASLSMTANPEMAALGEPVTFTITKDNLLPIDREWSVRDFLPESMEYVSATPSQGTCAPAEGYNVVQCDLGVIPSGSSATIQVVATPMIPGEITNYAADTGESQASATITVE